LSVIAAYVECNFVICLGTNGTYGSYQRLETEVTHHEILGGHNTETTE